jgi:oligoribonuclease NrnB/cAMP/cGMP phosphodiesterase (DHH superfamily)
MLETKLPLVIYHANCQDGFGAAYAAWLKLGDGAEYLPQQYGEIDRDAFVDLISGRHVHILDFSYVRDVMALVTEHAASVVWLDHHRTAFEAFDFGGAGLAYEKIYADDANFVVRLDTSKSGAMLAWEYYQRGSPPPKLISRIDDRDRWKFKYGDSKALYAGLTLCEPWNFQHWHDLATHGIKYENLVATGEVVLAVHARQVADAVKRAVPCRITLTDTVEHTGLMVNATEHKSEIGNALVKASGTFGLVWHLDSEKCRAVCSVRGADGAFKVVDLAKSFGGGGHDNAAAFTVPMAELMGFHVRDK